MDNMHREFGKDHACSSGDICCVLLPTHRGGADQQTLLLLYRSLIRSKLDYGCIVYGSTRSSYLRMLDPVQNQALRLCTGAFGTSPSSSLCVLAGEPPLYIQRRKLSIQYCLRLSSSTQNPAYSTVFDPRFRQSFEPNQIPTLGIRIQLDLQAIGFKREHTEKFSTTKTTLAFCSSTC